MIYVGLDAGTTTLRAIAFEDDGSVIAASSRPLPMTRVGKGIAEQDPALMAGLSIEVLQELASRLPEPPRSIGIANQRETVLAWNKNSLEPLGAAISWQDRRGAEQCSDLKRSGFEDLVARSTGLMLSTYFSASKYSYLSSKHLVQRSDAVALGTVDSWILANLTSSDAVLTDVTNASRTSLLNIDTNTYDEELAGIFEVPLDNLPIIMSSDAFFGELAHPDLEAWKGVPIHGVLGDQQASLFGQGCLRYGSAKATLGTGSFVLANAGDQRPPGSKGLVTSIAWNISGSGNVYCLEGSAFSTASTLKWLIEVLGIASDIDGLEMLSKSVRGSEQVTILPFFNGAGSPWWQEESSALLAGLETSTTKGQLARAGFESIALQLATITDRVVGSLDGELDSLKIDGGLSSLDSLCQLIADQSGLTCQASLLPESTAFGAAMMAAVGIGDIPSERVGLLHKSRASFEPSSSKASSKSRAKRWKSYLSKMALSDE